jgi:hypothetical protein
VDAVGAADAGRVFELNRALFQNFSKAHDASADQRRGLHKSQCLRSVHDIGGGEAEVQPAGFRPDRLRDRLGKGEHVVAGFRLNGVDALYRKLRFLA